MQSFWSKLWRRPGLIFDLILVWLVAGLSAGRVEEAPFTIGLILTLMLSWVSHRMFRLKTSEGLLLAALIPARLPVLAKRELLVSTPGLIVCTCGYAGAFFVLTHGSIVRILIGLASLSLLVASWLREELAGKQIAPTAVFIPQRLIPGWVYWLIAFVILLSYLSRLFPLLFAYTSSWIEFHCFGLVEESQLFLFLLLPINPIGVVLYFAHHRGDDVVLPMISLLLLAIAQLPVWLSVLNQVRSADYTAPEDSVLDWLEGSDPKSWIDRHSEERSFVAHEAIIKHRPTPPWDPPRDTQEMSRKLHHLPSHQLILTIMTRPHPFLSSSGCSVQFIYSVCILVAAILPVSLHALNLDLLRPIVLTLLLALLLLYELLAAQTDQYFPQGTALPLRIHKAFWLAQRLRVKSDLTFLLPVTLSYLFISYGPLLESTLMILMFGLFVRIAGFSFCTILDHARAGRWIGLMIAYPQFFVFGLLVLLVVLPLTSLQDSTTPVRDLQLPLYLLCLSGGFAAATLGGYLLVSRLREDFTLLGAITPLNSSVISTATGSPSNP